MLANRRTIRTGTMAAHQQGNVLILSLVLLAVLSVFGLSSLRGALTEERIAMTIQDRHLALEAAESALRAGERQLASIPSIAEAGYYDTMLAPGAAPDIATWTNATSYSLNPANWTSDTSPSRLSAAPRFKIEAFSAPNRDLEVGDGETQQSINIRNTTYYRIWAVGYGRSPTASAILESIIIHQ